MKKIILLLSLITLISCSQKYIPAPNSGLSPVDFKPPSPEEWKLPNGIRVYYMPDTSLPIVSIGVLTKGGAYVADQKKIGAASLMGALLRKGGVGKYSPEQLDEELSKLAATVSAGVSNEYGYVSMSSLASSVDQVFSIFSDAVFRPRFDEKRLKFDIAQALDGIKRRKDDPISIGSIAINELLFPNSYYGRTLTSKDIKSISRKDVLTAYKDLITPNEAIISVTGDITKEKINSLLEKEFGTWSSQNKKLPSIPALPKPVEPALYFLKAPFNQATILIAQRGAVRRTPDEFALSILNQILGGGATSRLYLGVRSNKGLAYDVGGTISASEPIGKAFLYAQTRSEMVSESINEILNAVKDLRNNDVTDKELNEVKIGLSTSFVFANSSEGAIVSRKINQTLLGYPEDYDQNYLKNINSISKEQIKSVAQKYLPEDDYQLLVIGDENAYNSLLKGKDKLPSRLAELPIHRVSFDESLIMKK